MSDPVAIRTALHRNIKAVTLRPGFGQGREVTRATITDGYHCEIKDGAWSFIADMPKSEGGAGAAPTPGVYGRGALASCLAMGIVMWAAEMGVPLDSVAVEVHADWDARGYLGLDQAIPPGYTRLRVEVQVQSPASEVAVRELVAAAERFDPYVDVFRRSNIVEIDVRLTPMLEKQKAMDAKLQRRIQRYGWDAAAKYYDMAWRENLAPAHDAMFDLADIKVGESVLDIACGSGLLTFRAAQLVGVQGAVTATDISEQMVRIVAEIARDQGLGHVRAQRMDAEALTLPAESFDAALCALGLMYMPDPVQALRQVFRVLRPGGRAIAAVWGERTKCGWAELFPIVDSFVQSEVCPLFFRLGAGNALAEALEEAGFTSISSKRLSVKTSYPSQREALTAMLDGGAVALAAKRFDEATRKQVEEKLLASFAPYRHRDGEYAIPGEFVVAAATKPRTLHQRL